jgi:hypothetical protein
MKKLILIIICSFVIIQTNACPICGCGVGNFYVGLLPNFKNKFIGVRYQYMKYHTQLTKDVTQFGDDYYKTVEVWSGWGLGKNWQLLTFIPYHINTQNTDDGIKKQNGLGDISLLSNYRLFHSQKINIAKKSLHQHDIWMGGGLKLPTGKYHVDFNEPEVNLGDVNAQMGTGSIDFLLNASYNARINDFGINTSVSYKINTANNDHYNFGNRFAANSFGYYNISLHSVSIVPNIGLLYERAATNYLDNKKVDETGGYVTIAATGVEINYKKIAIGTNIQMPFSQNYAHGQTQLKFRGMLHLSITL